MVEQAKANSCPDIRVLVNTVRSNIETQAGGADCKGLEKGSTNADRQLSSDFSHRVLNVAGPSKNNRYRI